MPAPTPLPAGIYQYKDNLYLLIGLCRMHETGQEFVAYVPLRTEAEWAGTARIALRPYAEFCQLFDFVGARQPEAPKPSVVWVIALNFVNQMTLYAKPGTLGNEWTYDVRLAVRHGDFDTAQKNLREQVLPRFPTAKIVEVPA